MKQILPVLFLFFYVFLFPKTIFAQVFINELSSATSDDWVELFSSEDTDISGWILRDTAASKIKTVPTATTIGPSSSMYYLLDAGNRLNSDTDVVSLYLPDDSTLVNRVSYGQDSDVCVATGSQTVGRKPDGGSLTRFLVSSKNQENSQPEELCSIPTVTVTITITSTASPAITSTSTVTPAVSPAKSTYKLNKSKNQAGEDLPGVKIYIDTIYTHHEDDEILEFCPSCFCDNSKEVPCGFGLHTITLTKTGYSDWSEQRNFTEGTNHEVTPVFTQTSTQATPTQTITQTPTSAPTKTPTPTSVIASPVLAGRGNLPVRQAGLTPSTESSSVLGDSTGSATSVIPDLSGPLVPEGVNSSPSNTLAPLTNNSALKYTFIFGLVSSLVSGGWLYIRHKKD